MTAADRPLPYGPKAVLMGGTLDGRTIRLPNDGTIPAELVVLVPDPDGRGYAVADDLLQPAVRATPVTYTRVNVPDATPRSRVHVYVPKRGRPTP